MLRLTGRTSSSAAGRAVRIRAARAPTFNHLFWRPVTDHRLLGRARVGPDGQFTFAARPPRPGAWQCYAVLRGERDHRRSTSCPARTLVR